MSELCNDCCHPPDPHCGETVVPLRQLFSIGKVSYVAVIPAHEICGGNVLVRSTTT
eukprot:SAG31_NODE_36981_length_308_cov_1.014354_1_plen_55_part_10